MAFMRYLGVALAATLVAGGSGVVRADYYSHQELRPVRRCAGIPAGIGDTSGQVGNPADPAGAGSIHCQRLFWDLPVVTSLGTQAVASPFAEDPIPRFDRGVTDRIPPMWVGTLKLDISELNKNAGDMEGFEFLSDCEANANGCQRLCTDPIEIPYWAEVKDSTGQQVTGTDCSRHDINDPSQCQTGLLYEVQCVEGSRSYYGPWQTAGTIGDPQACADAWQNVYAASCYQKLQLTPQGTCTPEEQAAYKLLKDAVQETCSNEVFDRLASTQPIRFDNTDRLDRDVSPGEDRVEWNVASEFYNHFSSHHGTCSQPIGTCGDPGDPQPREAYEPGGACATFTKGSFPGSDCYSGDEDPRCGGDRPSMGGFRNATQIPGRLSVPIPDGRGVLGVEHQMWGCNHHVVTQLPPGSYGMTTLANYRLQKHGIVNNVPDTYTCQYCNNPSDPGDCETKVVRGAPDPTATTCTDDHSDVIWGVQPGKEFGGAVGEMIIQYIVKPHGEDVKPVNVMFNAAADLATTYYPPFTWQYHEAEWTPPFDAAVALTAIHSHHRMVKGLMNVAPKNPPRQQESALNTPEECGIGANPDGTPKDNPDFSPNELYTDWWWEDAPVCEYWKQPDGPITVRKGQSLRTTCYVNNGVTPEAIKHGFVAGATVAALKALGAPIPEYPKLVPASTWGDPLAKSEVGKQLLYGTHPPINYRVVYKCSEKIKPVQAGDATVAGVPFATLAQTPEDIGGFYDICSPNPDADGDGDYIDGAYENDSQCGGGLCEPSSIVFACIGEDEMCIGVSMYWALPRLGNEETNDEAMQNLQDGDLDHVGTPGNLGVETDVSGICTECGGGPGL